MKALSVRQPWAWAIMHAGKDVENRDWHTDHRGPLLIHASRTWASRVPGSRRQKDLVGVIRLDLDTGHQRIIIPELAAQVRGALLGIVQLVDCVRDAPKAWAEQGMWHWLLEDPQPFAEPMGYRGKLGLFEVPNELVKSLWRKRGPWRAEVPPEDTANGA